MFIELDFNSNEAIYMQLRNQIILGIAQDKIKNGESLPSVRQLAEDIGVNMHTVNKAYALLRNDGYLKLDRRKGAVVCVTVESRKEQLEKVNLNLFIVIHIRFHLLCTYPILSFFIIASGLSHTMARSRRSPTCFCSHAMGFSRSGLR